MKTIGGNKMQKPIGKRCSLMFVLVSLVVILLGLL